MEYRRIPLGPLWTNSYVFDDGQGNAFCVDPGGEPSDVLAWLSERKLTLKAIVLTHGHMDHILGVATLKKATGAQIYMPRLDGKMASDTSLNLSCHFSETVESFQPDHLLDEGDSFTVGALKIETLHTPGHTPGSSCFVISQCDKAILVAGDTLFARSIGRTDLEGGSDDDMTRSLRRLKNLEGDLPVLPGHGPETSLDRERRLNPFLQG